MTKHTITPPSIAAAFSSTDLLAWEFDPIAWAVEGLIPEGLTVLAGKPKMGKSMLALEFAIAIATGGLAMGKLPCQRGEVLYMDMENGERRIQARLQQAIRACPSAAERLFWLTSWASTPDSIERLIAELDRWMAEHPTTRLIVIDVLQRVKPPGGKVNQNAYEWDYQVWAMLQRWAINSHVAVVGLHHTRKAHADDPIEQLSGSNGLPAVADTIMVLDGNGGGNRTLAVRGRDVEENSYALVMTDGQWTMLGEAHEVTSHTEKARLLQEMLEAQEAQNATDLAHLLGKSRNAVAQQLSRMSKAGEVVKTKRGFYRHPDRNDLAP